MQSGPFLSSNASMSTDTWMSAGSMWVVGHITCRSLNSACLVQVPHASGPLDSALHFQRSPGEGGGGTEALFPLGTCPCCAAKVRPDLAGQPRPGDCSWAVSCIESESRPNPGLLVLGQASWLCSQSPDSSGFLMIKPPHRNLQTRTDAILLCRMQRAWVSAPSARGS